MIVRILCFVLAASLWAQQKPPVPRAVDGTSADMWGETPRTAPNSARGQWLKDSRFAMFIHWGLYSELGGQWQGKNHYGISEWIMNRAKIPVAEYEKVAARFNPVDFNALEWVRTAKAAGMRHMMITSKHHDGFAMFGSKASKYNIVEATPFRRDVMKELADACAKEGIRLGFYYSQSQDWHEPDAVGNTWDFKTPGNFDAYLRGKAVPQIGELLKNYGPIATIWFDTPGPITREQSKRLVDFVHEAQPQAIVNSRIGNGLGDYETLGDMEIPRLPRPGLWESIDTHNDSWGYAINDINFKSAREIVERLLRVVSRGGVYMLNVGPDGKGRIPETSVRTLREVGQWVHANSAAVHGADPTPLPMLPWGECTRRGNTLYLHVFDWPADGVLEVPGLAGKIVRARMNASPVAFQQNASGATLRLPKTPPLGLIPVVTVEVASAFRPDTRTYLLSRHRNQLDPVIAKLDGAQVKKVRWMEKFGDWHHEEAAGDWTGAGSSVNWEFVTTEPGRYRVTVKYSCPQEDDYSEWQITADGKRITFPMVDSGERPKRAAFAGALPRFRAYQIGVVDFGGAGAHTLAIGPTTAAGKRVRIASVVLERMR